MCEIFPEVNACFVIIPIRTAMLFIAVLAVMTGVAGMCAMEQISDASYDNLKNVSNIRQPEEVASEISLIIPTGITAMSVIFMFTGCVLLFGNLTDDEGVVQVFVWVTFLAIVIGFVMVALICLECVLKPACMISGMDWFSSSLTLILLIAYLVLWFYFICVANSYVLNATP